MLELAVMISGYDKRSRFRTEMLEIHLESRAG